MAGRTPLKSAKIARKAAAAKRGAATAGDELDEAQFARWVKPAAALPGFTM